MDRIRTILDPYAKGVRRAVVNDAGLIQDKTAYPQGTEIEAISHVCHIVFDTEPRDAASLLHRAYIERRQSAWKALADDLRLGLEVTGTETYVPHVFASIAHPSSAEECYVSGKIAQSYYSTIDDHTVSTMPSLTVQSVVDAVYTFYDQDTVAVYQDIVKCHGFSPSDLGQVMTERPETCELFLMYPEMDQVCLEHPDLLQRLSDAAINVPVSERRPYMMMLATLSRQGSRVSHDVGLDTLVHAKSKFSVHTLAAAAVLSQHPENPKTVRSLCALVETLCTALQRSNARIKD